MAKVLGLIHEWKMTLCVHSKHKDDLVHIRDMHRLLSFKGKSEAKRWELVATVTVADQKCELQATGSPTLTSGLLQF